MSIKTGNFSSSSHQNFFSSNFFPSAIFQARIGTETWHICLKYFILNIPSDKMNSNTISKFHKTLLKRWERKRNWTKNLILEGKKFIFSNMPVLKIKPQACIYHVDAIKILLQKKEIKNIFFNKTWTAIESESERLLIVLRCCLHRRQIIQ